MFPNIFLKEDDLVKTVEELLDGLASVHSSSEWRVELLSRLERCFGLAVLKEEKEISEAEQSSSLQYRQSQWWKAQSKPKTCVALALISLLHRIHLEAQHSFSSPKQIDHESEMTACFTILQGLCLKDLISRQICSSKSTLELIIAIIDAPYWNQAEQDRTQPLAHAIDLLICVTMASRSASALFDALGGEEIMRKLMSAYSHKPDDEVEEQERATISLDNLQSNPIAIKCTEFLLLFASERNDGGNETFDLLADQTSIFVSTAAAIVGESSKIEQASKSSLGKPKKRMEDVTKQDKSSNVVRKDEEKDIIQRSRRARSASPIKGQQNRRMRSPVDSRKSGPYIGRRSDEGETPRVRRSVPVGRVLSAYVPTSIEKPRSSIGSPAKSFPPPKIDSQHRSPAKAPSISSTSTHSAKSVVFRTPSSSVLDAEVCASPIIIDSTSTSPNRNGVRSSERNALTKIPTPNVRSQLNIGERQSQQKQTKKKSLPFLDIIRKVSLDESKESNDFVQPSSPLKALMGPSPAVRRAYARSVSPEKRSLSKGN